MKKVLPVLALLSTSAFAQDLQLSDLNYFQKSGSVLVNTAIGLGTSENKQDTTKTEGDSTVWSNSVTYGLSDKLNVGIAFDYALKNETKSGTDKASDDKGLSDFTITGAYRLMDSGTYVDLLGGFTAAMGDREVGDSNATTAKNGNFKQGHHSLNVGVAAGQKINSFEWRAGLEIDHHLAGEFKDLDASGGAAEKNDTDSFTNYSIFGQAQYRMDKFVVGLGLDYTINGEQVEKDASKAKTTINSFSTLSTGITARYDLTSNVVLNAGYAMLNNYDVDGKDSSGDKFEVKDNKASVVSIGATLLF